LSSFGIVCAFLSSVGEVLLGGFHGGERCWLVDGIWVEHIIQESDFLVNLLGLVFLLVFLLLLSLLLGLIHKDFNERYFS